MGGRGQYASNTIYGQALKLAKGDPNNQLTQRAKQYIEEVKKLRKRTRQSTGLKAIYDDNRNIIGYKR